MTTSSTAYVVELVYLSPLFFDLVTYNDKKATLLKKASV